MYESELGNGFQRWIALTDAYAAQIEQKRIGQITNTPQLSVLASGLQKVCAAFDRVRSPDEQLH